MADIQQSLTQLPSPLTSLVIGGTSGIGAGIALTLAQHPNPQSIIYIAGRREDAAARIIQQAQEHHNDRTKKAVEFRKVDASLMKNIEAFCIQLQQELREGVINVLVLSQGIITLQKKDTSEGINEMIALNYYGRMHFVRKLRELKLLALDCIIVNILNAKAGDPSGQKIDFNDLDMRRTGIVAGIQQNFAMSDIMIQDFGESQDTGGARMTFIHDYPGFVKTDLVKNTFLKAIFGVAEFFLRRQISPEAAGEIIVAGAIDLYLKTRSGDKGYWYMDEKGREIVKAVTEPGIREKIRKHTWSIIDMALGDGVQHVLTKTTG